MTILIAGCAAIAEQYATRTDKKNQSVKSFLDLWYLQTLKYTTQDQICRPKNQYYTTYATK